MSKFKIGDEVVYTGSLWFDEGAKITIKSVNADRDFYFCESLNDKFGRWVKPENLKSIKNKLTLSEAVTRLEKRFHSLEAKIDKLISQKESEIDFGVGINLNTEDTEQTTKLLDGYLNKDKSLTRKEIVLKAKKDIEELKRPGEAHGGWWDYREHLTGSSKFGKGSGRAYRAEFIVNREKRIVTVELTHYLNGNEIIKKATAYCAPNDVFNADIGKAIALRRALVLDIPNEYLNASNPEEMASGDILDNGTKVYKVRPTHRTVGKYAGSKFIAYEEGFTYIKDGQEQWRVIKSRKIIDDTDREEYK